MPEVCGRLGPAVLPGPDAVARAIALLERGVERPTLSWSTVDAPVLVVGRSGLEPALNRPALRDDGVEIVERRSGGGPVLWDRGLVSLDVVVPVSHRLAGHDVTLAYRWIGEALAESLRGLGVPVHAIPVDDARRRSGEDVRRRVRGACFGGVSPFEALAEDGRKVVGLAQVRRRTGVLFQCGIVVRFAAAALARYLAGHGAEAAEVEQALRSVAAGLEEYGVQPTVADLMAAVEATLSRREGLRIEPIPAGPPQAP